MRQRRWRTSLQQLQERWIPWWSYNQQFFVHFLHPRLHLHRHHPHSAPPHSMIFSFHFKYNHHIAHCTSTMMGFILYRERLTCNCYPSKLSICMVHPPSSCERVIKACNRKFIRKMGTIFGTKRSPCIKRHWKTQFAIIKYPFAIA